MVDGGLYCILYKLLGCFDFFLDQKRNSRIYDISPCCKVLSKDKGKKGIIQEQKFVSIVFKLIKIFDALRVINEQKC